MTDQYLGQLQYFAFSFPPKGWANASGQLLSIQQNPALFSLFGTFYGGNGVTTFALPDLRGRLPIHQGQGPGLSSYTMGQQSGVEGVTLISSEMPIHNHLMMASQNNGTTQNPDQAGGAMLAHSVSGGGSMVPQIYAPTLTGGVNLAATTIAGTGANSPFSVIQPYLTLNCCVALVGVFPSRN